MEDDLPTEYDVIVIGTGMTESIVAAAASRVGKRVLHLDGNDYYGGLWASFNFDGMQKWIKECKDPIAPSVEKELEDKTAPHLKEEESVIPAGNQFSTVSNIEEGWLIPDVVEPSHANPDQSTQTDTAGNESQKEPITSKDAEDSKSGGEPDTTKEKGSDEASENMEGSGEGETKIKETESSCKDEHEKTDEQSKEECATSESGKETCSKPCVQKPPRRWSRSLVKNEYRKFNLDLAPKLLFARGSLVELLISSNIARYAEFRSVTRVLTWLGNQLVPVPCSRADVFSTKHVTVVEKRMLMKLLTACMEHEKHPEEFEGFASKTFLEFLKSKKLTPNLIHYVLYAIAMAKDSTPCMEGVKRTQRFLNSLGRYGNTPFLWPNYGSGEIPQCFCRLCAVFGGLYHLKRGAETLIIGPGPKCHGIVSGKQRLNSEFLVLGVGYAPPQYLQSAPSGGLSRGIFVTDRSIMPSEKEQLTLLEFPPGDGSPEPVLVIELAPSSNACPLGLHVIHMTCKQQTNAKEDLKVAAENLLLSDVGDGSCHSLAETGDQSTQTVAPGKKIEEESDARSQPCEPRPTSQKPRILWSLYFNCPETSDCDLSSNVPSNVYLCSGPDLDLDFEYAVKQGKEIFQKMYPDCEFLPRAPDPEEIVLEDDEGQTPGPAFEASTEADEKDEEKAKDKDSEAADDDAVKNEASDNTGQDAVTEE